MHSIQRGQAFLQGWRALAGHSAWDWRLCPYCGDTQTTKCGSYTRHPWTLAGRQPVRIQRHHCTPCSRRQGRHVTYSEQLSWLVRGGWYARAVRRCAIDHWQHLGTSVRRKRRRCGPGWASERTGGGAGGCGRLSTCPRRGQRGSAASWEPARSTAGWTRRGGRRSAACATSWRGFPPAGSAARMGCGRACGATRVLLVLTDSVTGWCGRRWW
jgi:hypothetical protein